MRKGGGGEEGGRGGERQTWSLVADCLAPCQHRALPGAARRQMSHVSHCLDEGDDGGVAEPSATERGYGVTLCACVCAGGAQVKSTIARVAAAAGASVIEVRLLLRGCIISVCEALTVGIAALRCLRCLVPSCCIVQLLTGSPRLGCRCGQYGRQGMACVSSTRPCPHRSPWVWRSCSGRRWRSEPCRCVCRGWVGQSKQSSANRDSPSGGGGGGAQPRRAPTGEV